MDHQQRYALGNYLIFLFIIKDANNYINLQS
jgi:hypothetical protein